MSRTRKTDPPRVRAARGEVGAYAHHAPDCQHGRTPCDLPPRPTGQREGACWWIAHSPDTNLCGCPLCTDADYRREDRRRVRHGAARDIAARLTDW